MVEKGDNNNISGFIRLHIFMVLIRKNSIVVDDQEFKNKQFVEYFQKLCNLV